MDTGSSGADSDLKVDVRTSSSLSEQDGNSGQHWDGASDRTVTHNEIAQVVENIYNYTSAHEVAYPSNNKVITSLMVANLCSAISNWCLAALKMCVTSLGCALTLYHFA